MDLYVYTFNLNLVYTGADIGLCLKRGTHCYILKEESIVGYDSYSNTPQMFTR